MPNKLTHDEYQQKVKTIHGSAVTVVGRYISTATSIRHKCGKCDNVWTAQPQNIIHKTHPTSCPKCSHPSRRQFDSVKDYQRKLSVILPGYTAMSDYKGANRKIRIRCSRNHTYTTYARLPLSGAGCGTCHHDYLSTLFHVSARDISNIIRTKRLPFRLIEATYVQCQTGATFECKKGHRFHAKPNRIYKQHALYPLTACPRCAGKGRQSAVALSFIDQASKRTRLRFQCIRHKKGEHTINCDAGNFKLDAYNAKLNLGLEFHGVYYHGRSLNNPRAIKRYVATIQRDAILRKYVNLFVVWEDEWHNSPERVLHRLKKLVDNLR